MRIHTCRLSETESGEFSSPREREEGNVNEGGSAGRRTIRLRRRVSRFVTNRDHGWHIFFNFPRPPPIPPATLQFPVYYVGVGTSLPRAGEKRGKREIRRTTRFVRASKCVDSPCCLREKFDARLIPLPLPPSPSSSLPCVFPTFLCNVML